MAAIVECCGNCRFYDDEFGACRRYPPVKISKTTIEDLEPWHFAFPAVMEDSWCGEFQAVICGGAPESSKL